MGRIRVPSKEADITVICGWDSPLKTYFAQVYRHYDTDNEEWIRFSGDEFAEHKEPEGIIKVIEPYAETEGLKELLEKDKQESDRPLTPLQRRIHQLFKDL